MRRARVEHRTGRVLRERSGAGWGSLRRCPCQFRSGVAGLSSGITVCVATRVKRSRRRSGAHPDNMKREILVNATPRETRVAIIEDGLLVELLVDRPDARRMVGDVYLGKVEAVLPGIQAAFVNIGTEKSAFLHAADVVVDDAAVSDDDDDEDDAPAEENGGGRRGRREVRPIQDLLKRGQDILVQITKEPISTKGPRVTAQVSLAGRFLVYMPFASKVGVSRKIDERGERQRLRAMVQEILPDDVGGVIVRTVSEDANQETFKRELDTRAAAKDRA